jgi:cytochrome c556
MRPTPAILTLAATIYGGTLLNQTPAAPPQGAPARVPQPIVPVAVTAIAAKPETFIGGTVSITAAVEQRFGETAFSVVQRTKTAADDSRDLLVIAPILTAPVEPGKYVTVIGEVLRFEPADVAAKMKDAAPQLPADVVSKYRGRPAIVATSVINNAMTDLAKRLPPPMSPEEQALSRQMKQIGPAFNALRQAVTAANAADVSAHATAMNKAFGEAAAFWKPRPHPDAIQWTEDAKRETAALAAAATRADWDAVKATVPKVQSFCADCHGKYRERLDDGTYRFKLSLR